MVSSLTHSVVFLEESIYCANTVIGAEVRADTISCFGGGSALQVQGRQAGLCLVIVAGTTVEAYVFCVQVLFRKVWVLLHEASELYCKYTTRGRQRQKQYCKRCFNNVQRQTVTKMTDNTMNCFNNGGQTFF